jgi:DNA modification methylase
MTRLGTATVIRADARALPLVDNSVDLICTSPPFYALRSYTDGGAHYDGQIGAEATPAAYINALIDCTREWVRVLKPSGSLWVNLGDKYNSAASGQNGTASTGLAGGRHDRMGGRGVEVSGIRSKSLLGLPWRYALRCIDELGLILRAEVIWAKPNGLPESVTDRVRRSHEQWFHMVRQPRYFSAVDEIRQPHNSKPTDKGANCLAGQRSLRPVGPNSGAYNPLGALPGSVWEIASQPLTVPAHLGVDHFAAFPMEWPRRIIAGWSPSGICTACGEGRRPTTSRWLTTNRGGTQSQRLMGTPISGGVGRQTLGWERTVTVTGEACACPDTTSPTRPAAIVDPFGGTGTTALVARALGRHGITVDRSADYCRLATWRTTDPGQLAAALEVPKPPVQAEAQLAFELGA